MQDKIMWFPNLHLRLLQKSRRSETVSPVTTWYRATAAAVMALLLVATFDTSAFAKGIPLKSDGAPSPQLAASTLAADTGVVVVATDEDGPAALAGIVRGDILLMAGGEPIGSAAVLYGVVIGSQPGDELTLVVQHGDEVRTIVVPLGQLGDRAYLGVQVVDPPGVAVAEAVPAPPWEIGPDGAIEENTEAVTETVTGTITGSVTVEGSNVDGAHAGVGGEMVAMAPGLIVAEVMADGPAAMAGLMAGDLILAVDRQPVASSEEMVNALKGHTPGEVALLTVQKGGPVGSVIADMPVTLGAAPDDPSRAYLGIRFFSVPSDVTVEMMPPAEVFTAPAMPALPLAPALPEPGVGYGYPYPGTYGGGSCVTQIFQYFYAPMAQGITISAAPVMDSPYSVVPFSAPLPPMPSARPVAPPVPYFIYHTGVNPEIGGGDYVYGLTGVGRGQVEENVIFLRAAPVVGAKAVVKSITVYASPESGAMSAVPTVPAATIAIPQVAQPATPAVPVSPMVPASSTVDEWF